MIYIPIFSVICIRELFKVWAQGFDGWRTTAQLTQLKWTLLAKGTPVINESQLATLILNILIKMCEYFPSRDADNAIVRPLPKIKRLLTNFQCLPHIVQLLLTFDPVLVERVATLLCEIMRDNPEVSKLYLTGVFYFIMMYTGSNVLPVARFLQLTHMKQAFRGDDVRLFMFLKPDINYIQYNICSFATEYVIRHNAKKYFGPTFAGRDGALSGKSRRREIRANIFGRL